jgi:PAS domain S-box-containing protein
VPEMNYRPEVNLFDSATAGSTGRYRCLVEGIAQIVWQTDASGEIVAQQPDWEAFTGQNQDQIKHWGWLNVIHPDDRVPTAAAWNAALSQQTLYQIEHRLRHHSGHYCWMAVRGVPIFDVNGTVQEWVGLHADITHQKRTELALQSQTQELSKLNSLLTQAMALIAERNQELDQFTYTVAHDLKAPLRAISNLARWVEEDLNGQIPPENLRQLEQLQNRVGRMDNLIDGLLEYSRIDRFHDCPEKVVVAELIAEIIDSIAPSPCVSIRVSSDLPTIQTNRWRLRQVFCNLIQNAIKHHHRIDGQIAIMGHALSHGYEFTITDDGPGIAPEQHDTIFQIFQTIGPQTESTGIGLAIVKKIVEHEGGQITLSSAMGQGSTFRFTWSESS